jgi:hypothetical protein
LVQILQFYHTDRLAIHTTTTQLHSPKITFGTLPFSQRDDYEHSISLAICVIAVLVHLALSAVDGTSGCVKRDNMLMIGALELGQTMSVLWVVHLAWNLNRNP